MPLIRRDTGAPKDGNPPAGDALAQLRDPNPDVRWKAVRDLAQDPGAHAALAGALMMETSPQVREAIFTSLVQIGSDASARAAATFIRSEDAALRTGALDALAAMPEATEHLLPDLLADADADVRLLSCELARALAPDVATQLLGALLLNEREVNVCGAAVEVLSEVGAPEAIGPMLACKARFPDEAFLGFAIDEAVARAGAGRVTGNG
jgi:HEAT repeat protein